MGRTRTSVLAAPSALLGRARKIGVGEVDLLADLANSPSGPAPEAVVDRAATALPGSSGTTGPPKSVRLTHGNLAAGVGQLQSGVRFSPDDVVLAVAPFPHVLGFVARWPVRSWRARRSGRCRGSTGWWS